MLHVCLWLWLCYLVYVLSMTRLLLKRDVTDENVMKHEVKTVGSLFFFVIGGYMVVFMGLGMFLRFLFTPW